MALITKQPLYYFLIFPFVPIFQFSLTPIFRLMELYQYLSPMLLVYGASEEKYDLHNGTSFDYVFVMRKVPPGRIFQRIMLSYYIEGLLRIIEKLESGVLPKSVEISGTSYFFSASTAERLGFSLKVPSVFYRINIYMNYLDLIWMYSLAKGRLSFPNLREIKAVKTTGAVLLEKKDYLERLNQYLESGAEEYKGGAKNSLT